MSSSGRKRIKKLIRQSTSKKRMGPTSIQLQQIAVEVQSQYNTHWIMHELFKRLNDDGKNYRHIYKALMILQYLLENKTPGVEEECKRRTVEIKTLCEFRRVDKYRGDLGRIVRERATEVVQMLTKGKSSAKPVVERVKEKGPKEMEPSSSGDDSSDDDDDSDISDDPPPPKKQPAKKGKKGRRPSGVKKSASARPPSQSSDFHPFAPSAQSTDNAVSNPRRSASFQPQASNGFVNPFSSLPAPHPQPMVSPTSPSPFIQPMATNPSPTMGGGEFPQRSYSTGPNLFNTAPNNASNYMMQQQLTQQQQQQQYYAQQQMMNMQQQNAMQQQQQQQSRFTNTRAEKNSKWNVNAKGGDPWSHSNLLDLDSLI